MACADWVGSHLVCYVDTFGAFPFLPLFSVASEPTGYTSALQFPPEHFLNEPLLSLVTIARGLSSFILRSYFLPRDEILPDKDKDINGCLLRFCLVEIIILG